MAGSVASAAAAQKAAKLHSLNGLFAIYKKQGPTSADVLNTLKDKLLKEADLKQNSKKRKKQILKIGHGGTLDSSASGVLVVGIGKGTKMLGTMLAGSKKYTTVGELGKATDTLDATGTVTQEKAYDHITKEEFEEKLKKFTGNIMQVPPLYSALKKDGQRLSVLLKRGHEVEAKPARPVTVYNLSLTDFSPPLFTIDVECGGGFYVRSLVDDIGKELSSCAHVKELVRTKQGAFTLDEHVLQEDSWTIDRVAESIQECAHLLSPEPAFKKPRTDPCHTSDAGNGEAGDEKEQS
ncbi:pseudouridylate synthase TRUB1 [Amia ocellicauda]|uniref:pseudouridylate synthase TRUB1 n=1 Tax=Amia ocellicauda TaxID=2972642 RepID=UPI003464A278